MGRRAPTGGGGGKPHRGSGRGSEPINTEEAELEEEGAAGQAWTAWVSILIKRRQFDAEDCLSHIPLIVLCYYLLFMLFGGGKHRVKHGGKNASGNTRLEGGTLESCPFTIRLFYVRQEIILLCLFCVILTFFKKINYLII